MTQHEFVVCNVLYSSVWYFQAFLSQSKTVEAWNMVQYGVCQMKSQFSAYQLGEGTFATVNVML